MIVLHLNLIACYAQARKRKDIEDASPIGMVRQLAKYCLKGAKRKRFAAVRDAQQKELPRPIFPKADVSTRWDSTQAAIARAIELKKTILVYTASAPPGKCPPFTADTFKALEQILPMLDIFLKLTKRYSKAEVNVHKAIIDIHNAIAQLRKEKAKAAPARRHSFQAAIDKLMKYMIPMLNNNWLCAAFALDPVNKEKGLNILFGPAQYDMPERTEEVVEFIRRRMQLYEVPTDDVPDDSSQTVVDRRSASPNPFASSSSNTSPAGSSSQAPPLDAWSEYNSPYAHQRLIESKANEDILAFWKRQETTNFQLKPLSRVARDVLSLPASSVDVERLFSHASLTAGDKRNLGPEMLLKQVCTKMWCGELGFLTLKDIEEML